MDDKVMRERYKAFWARPEVHGRMSNEDGNLVFTASEVDRAVQILAAQFERIEMPELDKALLGLSEWFSGEELELRAAVSRDVQNLRDKWQKDGIDAARDELADDTKARIARLVEANVELKAKLERRTSLLRKLATLGTYYRWQEDVFREINEAPVAQPGKKESSKCPGGHDCEGKCVPPDASRIDEYQREIQDAREHVAFLEAQLFLEVQLLKSMEEMAELMKDGFAAARKDNSK